MASYRISQVNRGGVRTWAIIRTNDDGTQDWLTEFEEEAVARAEAARLNAVQPKQVLH